MWYSESELLDQTSIEEETYRDEVALAMIRLDAGCAVQVLAKMETEGLGCAKFHVATVNAAMKDAQKRVKFLCRYGRCNGLSNRRSQADEILSTSVIADLLDLEGLATRSLVAETTYVVDAKEYGGPAPKFKALFDRISAKWKLRSSEGIELRQLAQRH